MADAEEPNFNPPPSRRFWPRSRRSRAFLGFGVLVVGSLMLGWAAREYIATDLIDSQLRDMGIEASYDIVSIHPDRQVLKNLVIGDPARPDLVIDRLEVFPRLRFGLPAIGRLRVVRPRLRGSYIRDQLSFGALDKVIFAEREGAEGLPDLNLVLVDGQAVITGDLGVIAIKAAGGGQLDHGFAGRLAMAAPQLTVAGCAAHASLAGNVRVDRGKPRFAGPMRLRDFSCRDSGVSLARLTSQVEVTGDADLAGLEGTASVDGSRLTSDFAGVGTFGGKGAFDWRAGQGNVRYDLTAADLRSSYLTIEAAGTSGSARFRSQGRRFDVDVKLSGDRIGLGREADRQLADVQLASQGSLFAPLIAQLRHGLADAVPGSNIAAELVISGKADRVNARIPAAHWRMADGTSILSVSQLDLAQARGGSLLVTGGFATDGKGLPHIRARMEQQDGSGPVMHLRMEPYRAARSELAIPAMAISQRPGGALGFAGNIVASGALPDGEVQGLRLPMRGNWSAAQGLSLWRNCTDIAFNRLALAKIELDQRSVKLCPAGGGAIVRLDGRGLRIAFGTPALALSGRLAGTPVDIKSGPIGFAWPGAVTGRQIDVALGGAGEENRFRISTIDARLDGSIGGRFSEADVQLFALPIDIAGASGMWTYEGGVLSIGQAQFRLLDRNSPQRFEPLLARDATLTLADNVITAQADLRHPGSDRVITSASIQHDVSSGAGHADLALQNLRFDEALQPEDLSLQAKGVIALVDGTVAGSGRIDWTAGHVTSSGSVSSDRLDFAAAFGPVSGASGAVEFTDLLNLTTAPDQKVHIGSINPGIEVKDGELRFDLRDGRFVAIKGGQWPFMGGQLILRPVNLNIGASEERRYVIEIIGADAGEFVASMELGNLTASGKFDGTVPLVFDEMGNGEIEGGLLISRPPGGNLSYVGELTYEDLSAMGNFAFQALRSLDFNQMQIEMDGPLTGEIVTQVRFDGIRQGAGASSNLVTRQLAKLPLQFRVNIRAPFYQLITSFKSMYDPAFVRDPRDLGLLGDDGTRFQRPAAPQLSTK